jgi:vancomycin resistance protein YoaR
VTEGGSPRIVDSDPGELVETEQLATNLLEVLADAEPRRVAAEVVTVEAEVTSADLEQLGVTEQVSTFTTDFEGGLSEPRSQNIVRVAEIVDGALVQPGEVFSLNGFTGERGYEQGFVDAPVILNGRLQPGVGGGISQFTTTLFNAAYYAGLQDVEHWPHSYWYSRYPSVIEATIFYPTLDLKFRNNTPYGILIDTSYTSGSVTVSMWSTRVWDEVTTEWGAKRDVTEPPTRYIEPGPTCIDTQGIDGFRQDAWRVFHQDGGEVTREKFSWRYDPQPQFICGEKPDRDQ